VVYIILVTIMFFLSSTVFLITAIVHEPKWYLLFTFYFAFFSQR